MKPKNKINKINIQIELEFTDIVKFYSPSSNHISSIMYDC